MNKALIVAVVALASAGCGEEAAETPASGETAAAALPAAAPTPGGGSWDEALAARVGDVVTIEGEFFGNDPESKCEYASTTRPHPAKTSWDWIVRKDGRCMSVSRGVDPRAYNRILGEPAAILDRANVGRKVEITARVAADGAGLLYLEFDEGRTLN